VGYLRHVVACNAWSPDDFLPLWLDGARVGFIRTDHVAVLGDYPLVFDIGDSGIAFAPDLSGPSLTAALGDVAGDLATRGLVGPLRGEPFAITERWGGPTLFTLDRAAVPFFGTRSYGVHLNGYVRDPDGLRLWIGLRAPDKMIAPGKLDNLVAGGIAAGYDAAETLVKEAAEEADMGPELAAGAIPVGAILYRMRLFEGMRDDVLFLYDLELDGGFRPRNTDGEAVGFEIMSLDAALARVRETEDFKFNVNLVLIDFALRHGAIGPDHPDYLALVCGLRGGR
jgi:8-oxo-dGTP pyrophosphatase MutT (NUDIX family)